ncbi:hypothetical protein J6590_034104 [Homalodisca vitripennis]|nr:hypothetical protein J6590_034104 [Homalodisca vitripennis]
MQADLLQGTCLELNNVDCLRVISSEGALPIKRPIHINQSRPASESTAESKLEARRMWLRKYHISGSGRSYKSVGGCTSCGLTGSRAARYS